MLWKVATAAPVNLSGCLHSLGEHGMVVALLRWQPELSWSKTNWKTLMLPQWGETVVGKLSRGVGGGCLAEGVVVGVKGL